MEKLERAAYLALNTIFGFEPAAGHTLLEALDRACSAFTLSRQELRELIGPKPLILEQLRRHTLSAAVRELEDMENKGYSFVCYGQEGYPSLLMECPDAPLGLYLRSDSSAAEIFADDRPKIAVVGTRDISHYGSEWCVRLVEALSKGTHKPLIVSGLALGTDIAAQQTALEHGLPTVGVMATGIDAVYPPQHEWAAQQIAHAPGSGLVTDYPRGTVPKAVNFVRRNRIIAGICSALVLVESPLKGGGMISARLAASYDREVYALPGRIDDRCSQGCNQLIRERLAEPVTDIQALVELLGLGTAPKMTAPDLREAVLKVFAASPDAARLADTAVLVKERRGIGIEDIAKCGGMGYGEASAMIRLLECEGFVVTDLFGNCRINAKKL